MPDCLVLPGLSGLAVQGLLALCCLGVFFLKRKNETAKLGDSARTKEEFVLDASKQFAGAGWIHVMNLAFASGLNSFMSNGDECEWYWINIMVDTTIGTGVAYVFLQIANAFIRKKMPASAQDFKLGEYRGEDGILSMSKYVKQLTVWLVVITCMKILMVLFMFLFSGPLLALAGFILAPFLTQPFLKLVVVMIFFPLVMDAFQIWMVDNFIKKSSLHPSTGTEHDPELVSQSYVEASADALLALSHKCEEATMEALGRMQANYHEALRPNGQDVPVKNNSNHRNNMETGEFETQFKFQTLVPPDQALD
jgi:hypothetical protein